MYLKNLAKWAELAVLFSSKTAPRIFIFSIVLGAEYSSYLKSIVTYAPAFLGYNNSVLARVKSRVRFRVRSCTNYTVGRNMVKGYSLHRVFIKYRSFLVVKSPKNANKVWLMAKTETIQYKFGIFLSQTVITANLESRNWEEFFIEQSIYQKGQHFG